jgi:hypothetical protein
METLPRNVEGLSESGVPAYAALRWKPYTTSITS